MTFTTMEFPAHVQAALAAAEVADKACKAAKADLKRLRAEVLDPAEARVAGAVESWNVTVEAAITEIVRCIPHLSGWEEAPRSITRGAGPVMMAVHDEGGGRWSGAILISVPGLARNVIGWASATSEAEAKQQLESQWISRGGRLDP